MTKLPLNSPARAEGCPVAQLLCGYGCARKAIGGCSVQPCQRLSVRAEACAGMQGVATMMEKFVVHVVTDGETVLNITTSPIEAECRCGFANEREKREKYRVEEREAVVKGGAA